MNHNLTKSKFIFLALLLGLSACNTQPDWPAQSQASFATLNLIDSGNSCLAAHPATLASNFFVLLGAGLLTGLSHCVGMCGPLVGAFAMRQRAERRELSSPLVLFQVGRLLTYTMLGTLAGSLGYVLVTMIQRWLAGLVPARLVGGWIRRLMGSDRLLAPLGLGLANGLLPCGPIYAMTLLAATSGSPLRGASLMLIFGLGTLPAMLGFGLSAAALSLTWRSQLYRLAASLTLLVGLQLALRGLALGGQISHLALGSLMIW
jgi:sulfite exporter TauE/SafE